MGTYVVVIYVKSSEGRNNKFHERVSYKDLNIWFRMLSLMDGSEGQVAVRKKCEENINSRNGHI